MRILLGVLASVFVLRAAAQPAPADPDWPCQQRLVQTLLPGSYWSGPALPPPGNWRDDEKLFDFVTTVTDRDISAEDGAAALNKYVDAIPPADRPTALPRLFSAIVDGTNDARGALIGKLEKFGLRQRNLADRISQQATAIDAIPSAATGADAAKRAELSDERDFTIRTFQEAERTVRYGCEIPPAMERRLGEYARLLQAKLGE